MTGAEVCQKAVSLIDGDRAANHGDKAKNLSNIATLWNAYLSIRRDQQAPLGPQDVCEMMSLLKKARKQSGKHNPDDYVDDVGYVAIGAELAG